jgi:hypothetical protein
LDEGWVNIFYAYAFLFHIFRLLNHGHILQVMKSQGAFRVWNIIFKTTGVLKFDFSWYGFGGIMRNNNSDYILEFA